MFKNIFSHWKTTLAGASLALLQVLMAGRSGKALVIAAATAIFGALVKDPNSN